MLLKNKAKVLKTAGAFHTSLMQPAQDTKPWKVIQNLEESPAPHFRTANLVRMTLWEHRLQPQRDIHLLAGNTLLDSLGPHEQSPAAF